MPNLPRRRNATFAVAARCAAARLTPGALQASQAALQPGLPPNTLATALSRPKLQEAHA